MADSKSAPAEFAGFVPETLKFLRALGFHQTREFFEENRDLYLSALKQPMEAYVVALSLACAARGLDLRGDPKKAVFRQHRDTRFSKNKQPFKTNGGCVVSRTGAKGAPGIVYTHVDPEGCWFAAGFRSPEPEWLLPLRRAIAAKPAAFLAMEKKLAAAGLSVSRRDTLTRNPREFVDADERIAHAIRLKSFIVRKPFADELLLDGPALVTAAADFARDVYPLLKYGWSVLD